MIGKTIASVSDDHLPTLTIHFTDDSSVTLRAKDEWVFKDMEEWLEPHIVIDDE